MHTTTTTSTMRSCAQSAGSSAAGLGPGSTHLAAATRLARGAHRRHGGLSAPAAVPMHWRHTGTAAGLGSAPLAKPSRVPRWVASAAAQELPAVDIPGSQQEAVAISLKALQVQVQPLLSGSKAKQKGFGRTTADSNRFAVELPIADTSAAATMQLAQSMLQGLPGSAAGKCSIVYADKAVADAAAKVQRRSYHLRQACQAKALTGPLILVQPAFADLALVEQLLEEVWSGEFVLLLNPGWYTSSVPERFTALVESFQVVYSFLPISIQGLLGGKEGAVLRWVQPGSNISTTPWKILYERQGRFVQVGQTKVRPKQDDLELAFMNASAATSPLTSAARGFRSLVEKVKKK